MFQTQIISPDLDKHAACTEHSCMTTTDMRSVMVRHGSCAFSHSPAKKMVLWTLMLYIHKTLMFKAYQSDPTLKSELEREGNIQSSLFIFYSGKIFWCNSGRSYWDKNDITVIFRRKGGLHLSEEQLWQQAVFNVHWPQSSEVKKTCNETDNRSL